MKKKLLVLFLLLTVVSFTKTYYGKEEGIATVYSSLSLSRPVLKNQTAQSIIDEFTRIVYEANVDYSVAPEKDYAKIDDYYMKRTNSALEKMDENLNGISDQDAEKMMTHFDKLQAIVDSYE